MKLKNKHLEVIKNYNFDYLSKERELYGMGKDEHRFLTDEEWEKLENGDIALDTDYLSKNKISRLGGIIINKEPYNTRPFKSRSDGDALYHAVFDAIAMALKIGNIGYFFPNTDLANTNLNSEYYLLFIKKMLEEARYRIIELGIIITKKKPYMNLEQIKKNLARILEMDIRFITLFSTTGEEMSMAGQGLGVHVDAFCRIRKIS